MFSLLGQNIRKFSFYLILVVSALVVYFTIGKPLIFDRIMIAVLFITAMISLKIDKNIFCIVSIILFERVLEEFLWAVRSEEAWFRHLVFLCVLGICVVNWKQTVSKLALGIAMVTQGAYAYWALIEYDAPALNWGLIMTLLTMISLTLLRKRIELWNHWVEEDSSLKLIEPDKQVNFILHLYIVLEAARLVEYLARHILNQHQMLMVYQLYPYIAHTLTGCILWIMLNESWRLVRQTRFFA